MKHIAIIGNGIAGITAARYIRKLSDYKITVISAESEHFWSRTALMYIYMGHMKYHHTKPYEDWFWPKNRIGLVHDYVSKVDPENKKLHLRKGGEFAYDVLIIASGSIPSKLGIEGEGLDGVCNMVSLQDLKKIENSTKNIEQGVIIGGGLIGIELAEMLLSRDTKVTFLVRENSFWDAILPPDESEIINKHIGKHHINLKLRTKAKEIRGENGRVTTVITDEGEEIPCQFVGVTVGVKPQIGFLNNSGIEMDRGILVDNYFQTNCPDIFAIGDCAQHRTPPDGRKPVEQIWYTGRIQGETVAKTICGNTTPYNPGVFFNSAKFLDIEYQVYGEVPAKDSDEITSFYWENDEKAVRIVFEKASQKVIGFNLLGIRYRQEVCEQWISTGATITEVINDLERANFDPEFHKKYEEDIRNNFKMKFPELASSVKNKRKKILGIF